MDFSFRNHKFCQVETRRWLLLVGVVAVTHVLFQSLLLPYGNALRSLFPDVERSIQDRGGFLALHSSAKSVMVRNPLAVDASDVNSEAVSVEVIKDSENSDVNGEIGRDVELLREDSENDDGFVSEEKGKVDVLEFVVDRDIDNSTISAKVEDTMNTSALEGAKSQESSSVKVKESSDASALEGAKSQENSSVVEVTGEIEARDDLFIAQLVKPNKVSTDNILEEDLSLRQNESQSVETAFRSHSLASPVNFTSPKSQASNANSSFGSAALPIDIVTSKNQSAMMSNSGKKQMKSEMPPKSITTIDEMNHLLRRHRTSSRAMRPRWSSIRDKEIIDAKSLIENAPIVMNDQELYAPLFRNVSMFKRSYELMERTLKVYVYKEGNKPIFHQPILKGLYASEGWFMKLMEGNKRFVVKDPRRAHLFYMPFSSRMLEYTLYVRNSHNRTNLRQHMREYTEKISAKYPFFNRTGGADHFLVACHDWAPYETRHHMERCMKALCNADVTTGFKIGRDVSLPETYVRSARNPLRDLGGKPALKRHILAFYAGNLHGYLRPILLKYWKDKDTDMKIFGPMPPGVASKMNYIQHMKSSKYCICPKGYEVNSPRVVESIFYECVPVIISDNFVPPFFEVLDWSAFSLILAEKDIPNLKDILMSIPEERYLQMQLGVRKVQRHFLWHAKPLKYDLFHTTLHSIWYNRVFQIKLR